MTIFSSSLAAVGLALLSLFLYRSHHRTWELLLRLGAVLILSLAVSGLRPAFSLGRRAQRNVVLLVDDSRSMASVEQQRQVQKALSYALPMTQYRFAFSESLKPFGPTAGRTMDGRSTNIDQALVQAARLDPDAIILISDGNHNNGPDPIATARTAAIPVHVIGIGKAVAGDVELVGIDGPGYVFQGDDARMVARVSHEGPKLVSGKVTMSMDGKRLGVQHFEMDGAGSKDFEFVAGSTPAGVHRVRAKVEVSSGDDVRENNQADFVLEVLGKKVGILFYTASPTANIGLVRRAFRDEPRLAPTFIAQVEPGTFCQVESAGVRPVSLPSLDDFDIVITDGVDLGRFPAARQIERFLQQGGAVIALLGAEYAAWSDLLAAALSVHAEPGPPDTQVVPRPANESIMRTVSSEPVPFDFCHRVRADSARAAILVESRTARPMVVVGRSGQGRLAVLLAYPLWQWGMRAAGQAGFNPAGSLLVDLVHLVSAAAGSQLELRTKKLGFRQGETIAFAVRAYDQNLAPTRGAHVLIEVTAPGRVDTIVAIEDVPGQYQAEYRPEQRGWLTVRAVMMGVPAGSSSRPTQLYISEVDIEKMAKGLNRQLLSALAEAGGGRYWSPDSLAGLGGLIATQRRRVRVALDFTSPLFLFLFSGFLIAEWILRKRRGEV